MRNLSQRSPIDTTSVNSITKYTLIVASIYSQCHRKLTFMPLFVRWAWLLLFVVAIATFYTYRFAAAKMHGGRSKYLNLPWYRWASFWEKWKINGINRHEWGTLLDGNWSSLILQGDNLHNLSLIEGFEIFGLPIDGKQIFILLISGLVVLPSVCFYNPKTLAYISARGVLARTVILGSIVWAGALDGVGLSWARDNSELGRNPHCL